MALRLVSIVSSILVFRRWWCGSRFSDISFHRLVVKLKSTCMFEGYIESFTVDVDP